MSSSPLFNAMVGLRALERVAEREHSHPDDLSTLLYIHHLRKRGERVLASDFVRVQLMSEYQAYSRVKRLTTAGWVVREATSSGRRPYPSLSLTPTGLTMVGRIRREARTCRETFIDLSKPLKPVKPKKKPIRSIGEQSERVN
jgi:hypothetical protein